MEDKAAQRTMRGRRRGTHQGHGVRAQHGPSGTQGLSSEITRKQSQEKCRVDTHHREAATARVRSETHGSPKMLAAKCPGFVWAPAVPASASALNSALPMGRSVLPWMPWGLCAQARLLPGGVNSAGHRFHNLHTFLHGIRSMWVSHMPVERAVCGVG